MKWFVEFFQEDNGGMSATRLLCICGTFLIIFTWVGMCIYKSSFLPFDGSHVTLITSLNALKFGQKFIEQKASNVADTTTGK
jgi:hypothetical protein